MRFELLGPLVVRDPPEARVITSPMGRLLLAELLLQANRTVSVDALVDVLWGEDPPRTAGDSLQNHVARLRRALGPLGEARLEFIAPGYRLHVQDGELDAADFSAHFRRARTAHAAGDWAEVGVETAAALALWRGQPLSDLPVLSGRPEIARLEELHLQVLEWRFDAELAAGRHHGLSAELVALVARYPLREAFHRQLMLTLHRTDRGSEALTVYQALRRTLVDELGSEPGPTIQAVHRDILAFDSGPVEPAASSGSPPAATTATAPFQSPPAISDFIGRRGELAAMSRWLSPAGAALAPRVVVVSGMGGMGKTTMALRAALHLRAQFPDGQLFADLRGFGVGRPRSAHDLLARFLTDLGVPGPAVPEHVDDRAALYRATVADRRILVVLDNARDAAQVIPLIPGSGATAVIVTSRRRLASLEGASHISLGPLSDSEQRDLLTSMCGAERVTADPDSATRILTACGGLPLAVRIAGAQLASRRTRPLSTLAARLSEAGGRLTTLAIDHLAVHDAFSASYDALSDSPRPLDRAAARAFLILGLWPAHALTPEAAAALLGESTDHACDLLDVLVDAHVLEATDSGAYRFHDLLGEFAAEQAAKEVPVGVREEAVLRLLHWYYRAATAVNRTVVPHFLEPPPLSAEVSAPVPELTDETQALSWYVRELPALKEVIHQARHSSEPQLAWRITTALFGYAQTYWWAADLEESWAGALDSARENGDLQGQARLHKHLGAVRGMAHRIDESLHHLRAAQSLFEAAGDLQGQASALGNLALAYRHGGQAHPALACFQESLHLWRQTGRTDMTASEMTNLGTMLHDTGDAVAAEALHRQALAQWRERGMLAYVAVVLNNLGDTLAILDRPSEAFSALAEALAIRRSLDDEASAADTLISIANTHLRIGDVARAREHWEEALAIGRALRLDNVVDDSLRSLATLAASEPTPAS
ncbi:AfsR/SARP family transcriptional regulator [Longispora fulva]|uniref:DNA-binding SARP family transcriptional activator/tetratricopeptide (TPR) repeat protein n=1 Tax=Longispora fulva TaxID=619741 RepID=A0A8J7GP98_9ACTN|nr:AfsR/SARP family transcriptional regulator [Longispora fulva]MBG6136409.1 DNA-binding SARP family transcriptional activator/tetratricopeptide (TPR) repeat protein [Longispora fulva]